MGGVKGLGSKNKNVSDINPDSKIKTNFDGIIQRVTKLFYICHHLHI